MCTKLDIIPHLAFLRWKWCQRAAKTKLRQWASKETLPLAISKVTLWEVWAERYASPEMPTLKKNGENGPTVHRESVWFMSRTESTKGAKEERKQLEIKEWSWSIEVNKQRSSIPVMLAANICCVCTFSSDPRMNKKCNVLRKIDILGLSKIGGKRLQIRIRYHFCWDKLWEKKQEYLGEKRKEGERERRRP